MMQKLVKLLEKYVQWIAVALGAAFLLYMGWLYIYNSPASLTVSIGNQQVTVTPGTVDKLISDGPASSLEEQMQRPGTVQIPVPTIAPVDVVGPANPTGVADGSMWDSWSYDLNKLVGTSAGGAAGALVTALPDVPALRYVDQEVLRSVVLVNNAHQDLDSVTTFWALPMSALAKAYDGAFAKKLPPQQQTVLFAKIDLIRQEKLPDGEWGDEVVVAAPFNAPVPPVAYPDGTDKNKAEQYHSWVNGNQPWLVSPTFPDLAFQDRADLQWQPLASWIPYRAELEYNESQPVVDLPPPTPTQTQAPRPITSFIGAPRGFGGGGSFGSVGGGHHAGGGPSGFTPAPQIFQQPQPQQPVVAPTTGPAFTVPPIPNLQPAPGAAFSPDSLVSQGDMGLYFFDLTAQPGKMYRYRVRYTVWNPTFNQPSRVKDPKLAQVVGMVSPLSPWSGTVVVPPRTRFWCSKQQGEGDLARADSQVKFNVYTWHDGLWQHKDYSDGPGDEIGSVESDGSNFLTHWTVLGMGTSHAPSGAGSVLLTPDDGGIASERDIAQDTDSQDYKHFKHDFDNQPKPEAAAGP